MDASELVGSWAAESGDSNLEFKSDGTYIRVTSVEIPGTYEHLAIDDEGTYGLRGDMLMFTPKTGHYRRNGVDEGFDDTVRELRARLEPNADQTGHDLVLDAAVWRKA
jgi:hypothetical protein